MKKVTIIHASGRRLSIFLLYSSVFIAFQVVNGLWWSQTTKLYNTFTIRNIYTTGQRRNGFYCWIHYLDYAPCLNKTCCPKLFVTVPGKSRESWIDRLGWSQTGQYMTRWRKCGTWARSGSGWPPEVWDKDAYGWFVADKEHLLTY